MKKVLIITYYWPPSGGSGVQRWLKFVKYLPSYGWKPVVYVPENPEYPVYDPSLEKDVLKNLEIIRMPIREPFGIYKKLTGRKKEERLGASFLTEKKNGGRMHNITLWVRANFFIPDARKWWIRPSVSYLIKYLTEHPVEVVVTNGPPMSVHMIGLKLKKKLNIRWLADFRDPWTSVDFYHELKLMKWADRKHHRLEREVLGKADAVTVISRGMAADFKQIVDREYALITNGFDEDDFRTEEIRPDEKFSIAHFGSMGKTRNPLALWHALTELKATSDEFARDLVIRLVGSVDYQVLESIRQFRLEENLERAGYLDHDKMIREMKRSQVLLLVINNTPNAKLIATGKLFEYLAARRPVLCLGPEDGDAAEIIRELPNGYLCRYDDRESIKTQLLQLFAFYSGEGLAEREFMSEKYSRRYLTGRMAEQLYQCIEK
ncbi:MAG: glycosyltransferase [Bacteroidales bacterium]|nr:glycosyltransferase [Lentimicrobiaceae bacterium]MDD5695273.1 glycosyltransferase [Bacteroidales bacterium]